MLMLVVTIDGKTRADLVAALRETLREVEAGQDRGAASSPDGSHDFTVRQALLFGQPLGEESPPKSA
jgi:hypothetical protein